MRSVVTMKANTNSDTTTSRIARRSTTVLQLPAVHLHPLRLHHIVNIITMNSSTGSTPGMMMGDLEMEEEEQGGTGLRGPIDTNNNPHNTKDDQGEKPMHTLEEVVSSINMMASPSNEANPAEGSGFHSTSCEDG